MLRDLKSWSTDVARELSISSVRTKKGFHAILVEMKSTKWRRIEHISDYLRSPTLDRFEKEVKRAQVLIAEREREREREIQEQSTLLAL